jgi:tRNA-binding EMAP/Myf-like protein
MHVGTIVEVKDFQARKPAYQLTIDFGETELEKLRHKLPNATPRLICSNEIVAVVNFPKNKLVSS